ncbi:hypothetical protein M409DRAFT_24444 [Zasmidium cellare ATCC 36951]|uniref:DUF7730 domain-containing protein n=1 Tax=Zasmidium cellare ATCC 36951 TaxID=1080233 RepID=A0A6A6CFX2_ZASCE|nr:uncharacterized protein M409DRAFT_24444 [Zasmidium cellare ATCC 36951]KAF2165058.1 hypothetical protein M409DRAFT_24444 [Zasmidium cellare ATCC 36951]
MEPLEVDTICDDGRFTSYAGDLSLAFNVLLGAQTPYDENEEAHVRTLTVKNDTNFRVCPITITEGPMKGYYALVLVPTCGFRFLDLPTEIRYMIYELSIAPGKTDLRLAIRENRDKKDPKVVGVDYRFPATKRWQEGRKFEKWIGQEGKWIKPDERATMSLLLVNKQVSGEAFEVLYRSHTFHFVYPAALDQFLKLNGTSAKFLTSVELSHVLGTSQPFVGRMSEVRPRCAEACA